MTLTPPPGVPILKTDVTGIVPRPLRVPTLNVIREWPNMQQDFHILWASGVTAYAVGGDYSIRKTTDGGYSWSRKNTAALTFQAGYHGCFLKTTANTLLTAENSGGDGLIRIRRSTDDGVTWSSAVLTMRSGTRLLSSQSWCQDANTGYLYLGEYATDDATRADINIYRSTDDGATWSIWKTFYGPSSGNANRIRHVHACQYDSVSQRVYFCIGDQNQLAGIYRVNSGGTDVEDVCTNWHVGTLDGAGGLGVPTARAVALMFFPNYLAWVTDDSYGSFVRMNRSQIGSSTPILEPIVYQGLGSGWGTIRASSDGSTWLAATDNDSGTDPAVHLFAVSDEGSSVWEVGSMPTQLAQLYNGFVPIGQAELHDAEHVWLAHNWGASGTSGNPDPWYACCTLTRGLRPLAGPRRRRKHGPPNTICSGVQSLTAGQTMNIMKITAPALSSASKDCLFYVLDYGIFRDSGTGVPAIEVLRSSDNLNIFGAQGPNTQGRDTYRAEDEFFSTPQTFASGVQAVFRLRETGGSATAVAAGFITYAWGHPLLQDLY